MNKIKNLLAIFVFALVVYACDQEFSPLVNPFENVDYEALAISDNDSIVKLLKSHYYDQSSDEIKLIDSGQTPLYDDVDTLHVKENDINHILYVYVKEQGIPAVDKAFPTIVDSLFVNYELKLLVASDSIASATESNQNTWFTSDLNIRGWAYGFTKLKGGNNVTNNGPLTFQDTGKAILFIPSGLGYPSIDFQLGQNPNARPFDRVLVFDIELLDFVKDTDHDNDGVSSAVETLNDNGDAIVVDTDEDGVPNYLDIDDDGDGVLTRNEDSNSDGDPTNDFNDTNNPTLPDYLNPIIK